MSEGGRGKRTVEIHAMSSISPSHTNWQVVRFEFGSRDMEKGTECATCCGQATAELYSMADQTGDVLSFFTPRPLSCLFGSNEQHDLHATRKREGQQTKVQCQQEEGRLQGKDDREKYGRDGDQCERRRRSDTEHYALGGWALRVALIPDEVGHQNGRIWARTCQ